MRSKFEVAARTEYAGCPSVKIELHVVMQGSEENKQFWSNTPNGKIELFIQNELIRDYFQVGKEYYVDFVEAI